MKVFASSETLTLRRFLHTDLDLFLAYRMDPDVARFQSWDKMDRNTAAEFLQHLQSLETAFRPGGWNQIAIADPQTNSLIGDLGLFLSDNQQETEIGITLAKAFQGRGLGSAAMKLAIGLAFESTPCRRIICGADQRNLASIAMIRRLGFRYTHSETTDTGTDDMFDLQRPV